MSAPSSFARGIARNDARQGRYGSEGAASGGGVNGRPHLERVQGRSSRTHRCRREVVAKPRCERPQRRTRVQRRGTSEASHRWKALPADGEAWAAVAPAPEVGPARPSPDRALIASSRAPAAISQPPESWGVGDLSEVWRL